MFKLPIAILLLTLFVWSSAPQPEKILTESCLKSYQEAYKSLQTHKAFVYARESETGKDRCGWGYGHESGKEAKKSAMKQCTGFQLNAECILIDVDNTYLVKDGDFTPITQPDNTPLSKEEEMKLVAEAKSVIRGNCIPFFKTYLKDEGHKVFGYSIESNSKYACGKAYKNATLISAKKGAIKACEENRNARGKEKPKTPCRLYAEGNKILLYAKDFTIEESLSDKALSNEEYSRYLKQTTDTIREGPCLFQMKYYLKGTLHQAYFLAQDSEGKQACGRSEDEASLKDAISKAKKECQSKVSQDGLKATCKVFAKDFEIVGKASDFNTESKDISSKSSSTNEKPSTKKSLDVSAKTEPEDAKKLLSMLKKSKESNSKSEKIDMYKPVPLGESIIIATEIANKNLPKMLDEELRLNKVHADGNKMIFDYTLVNFTPEKMPAKELKTLLYKDIKTEVCSDKETIEMLKKGMSADYLYKGKNGKHITTFIFDAKVCGMLTNIEKIKQNILNMVKEK